MEIQNYIESKLGEKENPSPQESNPYIGGIIAWGRAWIGKYGLIDDGKWPWCALFVNDTLEKCGYYGTFSNRARSFLKLGRGIPGEYLWGDLNSPYKAKIVLELLGKGVPIIAIFKRGRNPLLGHVAFLQGLDSRGLHCLGGNQGNEVKVSIYPFRDLIGLRIPKKKN